MDDTRHAFECSAAVRDYECDMHGVVNNAVYLNYLEHARRCFLGDHGLGFHALAAEGLRLLMTEMTIRYLQSLVSGDSYSVRLGLSSSNGQLVFKGDIFRAADGRLCARSTAKIAVLRDGRLTDEDVFKPLLARLL